MSSTHPTVNHPQLKTTFHGISHLPSILPTLITQFRGIQYATIHSRFRRAILRSTYPESYDARNHGPPCPQPAGPMIEDVLSGLIAQPEHVSATSGLPSNVNWTPADEFKCLNLVITCPADVKPDAKLPVMVYIHGGGCLFGSNQAWLYDSGNLVARSVQLTKPVIIVSLNYRLSGFGWLASDELKADNEEAGDVGVGNYGAYDTYLGLEWVYRFIAPFGADPDNITLFGESGGAFMVDSHIHCALPSKFGRAILLSGTLDAPPQSDVVSIKHQNSRWEKIKKFTKTKNVEELRSVPTSDLVMAWFATEEGNHTAAVPEWTLDGAWLKDDWEETVSSKDLQVIIGDVEAEKALYAAALGAKPKSDVGPIDIKSAWNEVEVSLATKAVAILKAYGADSSSSAEELMSATSQIIGDLSFRRATDVEAQRLVQKGIPVYRYVFDQGSPFPLSPFKGQATHSLDLNYCFGNPRIFSGDAGVANPESERKIQQSMQEKWIAFANGEVPWRAQSEDRYYAFGPNGFDDEIVKEEFEQRRETKRWAAFEGLSKEELITFGIACNKAFTGLSGHRF